MTPQQAMDKAKIALMSKPDSAFFTTLVFSMKLLFDKAIPTACTNGKKILFNPDFFMAQDQDVRVSIFVHEAMHVAYLHVGKDRIGHRDPRKWNIAGDYVINAQLKARGFVVPDTWLYDPQYADMSTEMVYDRLPPDPPPPPMEDIDISGDPELVKEVEDILVRAAIYSKQANDKAGTVPLDIEVYLDKLLNPKLPWNRIMANWFQSFAKTDYSWKKPNRRFFPEHHLPSMYGTALMNIGIGVDISSSVTDHEFKQQISEVHDILVKLKPEKITLLLFNTQISVVKEIKSARELLDVQFTGRGGTDIDPVIEYANEHKLPALLVLSDGGFNFSDVTTKTPTIFVVYNNPGFEAPFGKVVHYEIT